MPLWRRDSTEQPSRYPPSLRPRRPEAEGVAPWLRNATMILVLLVWLAVCGATLLRGQLPDAAMVGLPAVVFVALSPSPVEAIRRLTGKRRE